MSFGELLFLAVLALLVFGPRKLPEIARQFGRIMTELRRASNEFRYSLEEEVRELDRATRTALPAAEAAPVAGTVERTAGAEPKGVSEPEAETATPAIHP